jgi:hypothetical protein
VPKPVHFGTFQKNFFYNNSVSNPEAHHRPKTVPPSSEKNKDSTILAYRTAKNNQSRKLASGSVIWQLIYIEIHHRIPVNRKKNDIDPHEF